MLLQTNVEGFGVLAAGDQQIDGFVETLVLKEKLNTS
jgi:hypothetical protein